MDGQAIIDALKPLVSETTDFSTPFAPKKGVGATRWTDWKAPTWNATVKPSNVADVQAIVKYCTEHNQPFMAVGSGHGYSAHFGKAKDILQIDINNFKDIDINTEASTMTIGAAVLHSEVVDPLWKARKQIRR